MTKTTAWDVHCMTVKTLARRQARGKTFAAMTTGGFVLFVFAAENTAMARLTLPSLRRRSDTITGVRLLRGDDLWMGNETLPQWRGPCHAS